ncbi:MAG: cytochrome b [Alphaproteobacteria bacterium]|nr:cytochrome b [Alphaproteobacteria bacterium]
MTSGFTRAAIALHWLTVLLMAFAFGLGLSLAWLKVPEPLKLPMFLSHEWLGVAILGVALVRLIWRRRHPPPPPLPGPAWQHLVATLVHAGIYGLLIATPVVGWIASTALGFPVVWLGVIPLPDFGRNMDLGWQALWVHRRLAWALGILIAMHVGAALMHHLVFRDDTLRRMAPWLRR